jgi:carboxypeptidase C (cathepsin A)
MKRLAAVLAALTLAVAAPLPTTTIAQQPQPEHGQPRGRADVQGERRPERAAPDGRRLPPDSVTQHTVELPGRTLRFTATAGALPLTDPEGRLQAEIGFVAYTLDGADRAARPVTFALNGGPGAASAYLHLGVLGPWRLPLDGPTISPSAPVSLTPNAETWLDFTDLVFIDPVETGYSRATASGEDLQNRYFTVEGDATYLAAVIARWLRTNDRLASPKFFIGESYGGFRGPLIAHKLQSDYGAAFSGLVLLSPVLDFGWFSQPRHAPWVHAVRLPSLAASALEAKGPVTRERLKEAESYAVGEYLTDLMRGLQDPVAVERVSSRVAALTGVDPALARRMAGRTDMNTFQHALGAPGRVVSAYDTGISGYDPEPTAVLSRSEDPLLTAMTPPLTSAIVDHLALTLNWKVLDDRYNLLNGSVNGQWRWGRGRGQPESVSDLRQALALDGKLRVLVAHGFTDLVTPYFASQLLLNQLPDFGPDRVSLAVYPGGHMFYSRPGSRAAFRDDALRLYRAALDARSDGRSGP